jgi:hypothetical protein
MGYDDETEEGIGSVTWATPLRGPGSSWLRVAPVLRTEPLRSHVARKEMRLFGSPPSKHVLELTNKFLTFILKRFPSLYYALV